MTKHDEVRQILHNRGFKFKDSERTALDMTDEEVDAFLVEFFERMSKLAQALTVTFQQLTSTIVKAMEPLQDLSHLLAEEPEEG